MIAPMLFASGACISAGLCGAFVARGLMRQHEERQAKLRLREAAGIVEGESDHELDSTGIARAILESALALHKERRYRTVFSIADRLRMSRFQQEWFEERIRTTGLADSLDVESFNEVRVRIAFGAASAGALVGMVFSGKLAFVLGGVGAIAGFCLPLWAMRQETLARVEAMECELPQMLEVVSLGLHSGLTFDRSFQLYCEHFPTSFSKECERAQHAWEFGLEARSDALRNLAKSYNSVLFERVVESIIRSLRFGSSLADMLESVAAEARAVRKAHMEEQVAKAPVKMMIPTGTLILPAMLLLVLGPILLELMEGF